MVQIGGVRAPSPVGELGNVEMTQALNIVEPHWQGIGPDMLLTGYLPASGGLEALDAALSGQPSLLGQSAPHQQNGTSPSTSASDLGSRGEARRQSHANVNKVACYTAAKAHHQGIRVCNDALRCGGAAAATMSQRVVLERLTYLVVRSQTAWLIYAGSAVLQSLG